MCLCEHLHIALPTLRSIVHVPSHSWNEIDVNTVPGNGLTVAGFGSCGAVIDNVLCRGDGGGAGIWVRWHWAYVYYLLVCMSPIFS